MRRARAADFERELQAARARDAADPLAPLRGLFSLPRAADGQPLQYLCGHSLGLAPLAARASVVGQIEDWERLGVEGHTVGRTPWIDYAERLQPGLARLAGAAQREVVAMNSLGINLHLLLAGFYRPTSARRAILIEAGAFSSDRHVVAAQIAWHGLDPATELIELAPRAGESAIRIEDIERRILAEGERLALVLWPGVQYLTGQAFDLKRLVQAAHHAGCPIGFDLAHAIGNIPLSLHEQGADFAAWCGYKYLNGGPGAIGGAFVHECHLDGPRLPMLRGWWGHERRTRFELSGRFVPADGAAAWAVSNPPILSAAPLTCALPLFEQAGMAALRRKSVALTGALETLLREWAGERLSILTPSDPAGRGCQLSLHVRGTSSPSGPVAALDRRLRAAGVIGDWREPGILRLAPVPLYNCFEDVVRAAWQLSALLDELG